MNSSFSIKLACVFLSLLVMGCDDKSSLSNENETAESTPKEPGKGTSGFAPGALGMTPPLVFRHDQLDDHIGQLVAIRGIVSNSKAATILGVDIKPGNLRGQECYALGILAKTHMTQEQLSAAFKEHGPFQTRGSGDSYILYSDLTGKLAEAREWSDAFEP